MLTLEYVLEKVDAKFGSTDDNYFVFSPIAQWVNVLPLLSIRKVGLPSGHC